MTFCTRPRIIFCRGDDAGAHRIRFYISDRCVDMRFIQRAGEITTLPEVSCRVSFAIEVLRILHVDISENVSQGISGTGNADDMDVIRHEAIGPDFKVVLPGVLSEQLQVTVVIIHLGEHVLPVIASLGDMVGITDGYGA